MKVVFFSIPLAQNNRSKALKADNGSTAVELALVFPVLAFLLFGFIQFGLLLSTKLSLESASSVGARVAITGADEEVVKDTVIESLPSFVHWNANTDSITVEPVVLSDGESAVKVEVAHHLKLLIPFVVPGSQNGNFLVTSSSIMR